MTYGSATKLHEGNDEVADMAVVMSRFGCENDGGMLQGYKVLARLRYVATLMLRLRRHARCGAAKM
jgi:hypothetical protein